MFELVPSVNVADRSGQGSSAETAKIEYDQKRYSVLVRDNFSCQACGFKSKPERDPKKASDDSDRASGYLNVFHIDDWGPQTKQVNKDLVTLCPFCHQVFSIGLAGQEKGAKVIYFPHLSQGNINLLANLALVQAHQSDDNAYSDYAVRLLMWLQARATQAIEKFGEEVIDPKNLGAALFQLYKKHPDLYQSRGLILQGLRLLPTGIPHQKAIDWWSKTGAWTPNSQWDDLVGTWKSEE
ncbi:HNH endonuclease (plasmid) [Methylomarinum sp. Ch1-1]|uniref:HNH endonuclease n=1 Tax=Methylomarinum roseum TaxID=3067653 RepID=A0AAU7P0P2_9GAMM|nr:HNH endonuclease [Methylomarinum sp. Ch1-1]MDP4523181.1 HNH endonuclease [Methylomarinum sp. Ch1-1]